MRKSPRFHIWIPAGIAMILITAGSAYLYSHFFPYMKSAPGMLLIERSPNQIESIFLSVGIDLPRPIHGVNLSPEVSDTNIQTVARLRSLRGLILTGHWNDPARLEPLWKLNSGSNTSGELSFITGMGCGIDGDDAAQIMGLNHIKTCYLSDNPIADFGSTLTFAPSIRSLVLNRTRLSDKGFEQLAESAFAPTLQELRVDGTCITDSSLARLQNFKALKYLNLANNPLITDAGFRYVQDISNLNKIDVSGTKVTADGILKLECLSRVKFIIAKSLDLTDEQRDHLKSQLPQIVLD